MFALCLTIAYLILVCTLIQYFSLDPKDIDECVTDQNNCTENANCNNTNGGFICECSSGYSGVGDVKCTGT